MSFLLDTDICSAYLRGNRAIANRVLQYSGRLFISTLTIAELHTWAMRSGASPKLRLGIEDLCRNVEMLDFTYDVAVKLGEIRANQLDLGRPRPAIDLAIAATAISHDLTLVTHNTADFADVPGLHLEDWLAP